jgi:hypothetical protein
MITFGLIFAGLALAALTAHALIAAPNGHEDEGGYSSDD